MFQNAMTGFSELEAAAIIAAFDFSSVRTMVDVGGGQGALAATLLRSHQRLHAVIFHRAAATVRTCAKAMLPDARLLIAERMIPPGNGPSEAKLFDINMLVTVGGRERTQTQYANILRSGGLRLRKVTPTASHLSLIEAEKTEQE